ncbi:MAG TPA: pyridoxal 5'-phosphate synthase glutaminase subunit PdxT [Candidatus Micrarchaeota archaeon]|nr:pyridoxal 5'-phosphate synthase glutaminase subunit PdxT [Candidatus Micrarchaeota archaeon]
MIKIGILALQGDVREHGECLKRAAGVLGMNTNSPGGKAGSAGKNVEIAMVRTATDLDNLDGIILPGGESTTMWKLLVRHGMVEKLKKVPCVFGTCAGLILMSKHIEGKIEGQESLGLMDCAVSRNAYGPQIDSFEAVIEISVGSGKGWHDEKNGFHGNALKESGAHGKEPGKKEDDGFHGKASVAFIRAPIITDSGSAKSVAKHGKDIIGIEKETVANYYLGLACHPEITGETFFHRRFLEKCSGISENRLARGKDRNI